MRGCKLHFGERALGATESGINPSKSNKFNQFSTEEYLISSYLAHRTLNQPYITIWSWTCYRNKYNNQEWSEVT